MLVPVCCPKLYSWCKHFYIAIMKCFFNCCHILCLCILLLSGKHTAYIYSIYSIKYAMRCSLTHYCLGLKPLSKNEKELDLKNISSYQVWFDIIISKSDTQTQALFLQWGHFLHTSLSKADHISLSFPRTAAGSMLTLIKAEWVGVWLSRVWMERQGERRHTCMRP